MLSDHRHAHFLNELLGLLPRANFKAYAAALYKNIYGHSAIEISARSLHSWPKRHAYRFSAPLPTLNPEAIAWEIVGGGT